MTGDGSLKIGVSLCPEVGRWPDTLRQARLAVELGFDSVWLPEHHLTAGYVPSPLLGLAGLVEHTGSMTLGTDIVVAPFANPVRLAEEAAMLQDMSGGRFVLGVGLGYRRQEFDAFNVDYATRGSRLDEQLQLLRRMWNEENVTHDGRHFQLRDVTIYPRVAQPPPLWLGGWAKPAVRRAALLADAWFPGPTAAMSKVRDSLREYDQALAELGRERTDLPIFREVWVAENDRDLAAGMEPLQAMYQADYVTWGHSNLAGGSKLGEERFVVGSPDAVAKQLASLRDELGISHLVARLHFHGIDEQAVEHSMGLLADNVRRTLKESRASA